MYYLEKHLRNFPKRKENTFERLQMIVQERLETVRLRQREKVRIEQEMSVIKDTDTASVFLFFYDTVYALKDVGVVAYGAIHCSYLCYFLGITKVNPFDYKLPFERYFEQNRKRLPFVSFAVKKGKKGEVIHYLKEYYGVNKIARVQDRENEYILSNEGIFAFCEIEQTILHVTADENVVWHEDVSSLAWRDTGGLELYTFTIDEVKSGEYRVFTDEEIYQKTLERFGTHNFEADEGYFGIKAAEHIFAETDGKFVYQEQFYTLCNRLLGVDNTTADLWRKSICKRRKSEIEPILERFESRLGETGAQLFDYLYNRMPYAVCKAYVIGLLFLNF